MPASNTIPTSHIATLVVYCVATGLALWAVTAYYVKNRIEKKLSAAVIFSSFWALVAAGLVLLAAILAYTDDKAFTQSLLAGLGGAALGWLIGMYISPIGTSEATAFQKYSSALAGVFSGYTLKSVIEFTYNNAGDLKAHWLPIAIFSISTLLSIAAVYNSRAYDNKLIEVHIKGAQPEMKGDVAQLPVGKDYTFYARVVGPSDPTVTWDVYPPNAASYKFDRALGKLTTIAAAANFKIIATNLEDPSLSNFIAFDVI